MLTRSVYSDGRQFDTVSNLKEAIFYSWGKIDDSRLRKLAKRMPARQIELIEKGGGETSYA